MEVAEVIQYYDSDRRFAAWGFGGRTYGGTVSHCFNLNGSPVGFEVGKMIFQVIGFQSFGCKACYFWTSCFFCSRIWVLNFFFIG